MTSQAERDLFWAKVDKTDNCWNWTGSRSSNGRTHHRYGNAWIGGKCIRTHRFSYAEAYGPIPAGLVIDHMCHNTACVRPSHLRAITQKQNCENRNGAAKQSKTGIRGVYWDNHFNCYKGTVQSKGSPRWSGYFQTIEEAESAVIAKRLELMTHSDMDRMATK